MAPLQPIRNTDNDFQAAVRAFSARDWGQAETLCRQVLLADPRHADALHLLGLVLSKMGRSEDAIARLRESIAQKPDDPIRWTNLGRIYSEAGRFAAAVDCQLQAVSLKANFPEAYYSLSLAYWHLGQIDTAIAAARRATELRPDYVSAHTNLGNLLREEGRLKKAVAAYRTALQIRPDWCNAHLNLAAALLELGEPADALVHCRAVLRLEPGSSEAENAMGRALTALGQIEEAKAAYARAAAGTGGNPLNRMNVLFRDTLAEVIAPGRQAIEEYKARVTTAIQAFAADPGIVDLSNLHTQGAAPSIMLAYYGGDVRPIAEQYAQAIGPHIPRAPLPPRQGKPKLGIVVTASHEGVFARCWGGIAERLSRDLFDVRLVCSRSGANILQTILKMPEHEYLRLPAAVDEAARLLGEHAFDWLHYWEIGTDAMNYYLPFFRPAPGQSGCWGWPVTSGNPSVNAYLSCKQLEPPDGATYYTEQLIQFAHLPTYSVRPPAPRGAPLRSRFGLEDTQHIYLCTQNLRKYHPDFDPLLADVLRTDPQGVLLIIADEQASITDLLLNRFRRTIPDVVSRVRVMPRMERDEYLSLTAVADVILDTLHYGGGANTVYDAVAVGTPMITLPGEFHRTRWAAAVNRRLGLERLIAGTPQEYVAKVVEVARDADLRQSLRGRILQAGEELFEDAAVISEHDAYFSEAIAATRKG